MMKTRTASRIVMHARPLNDQEGADSSKSACSGDTGSLISEGKRRWKIRGALGTVGMNLDTRSRNVGSGFGAMNAMEKSFSPTGEDGVTMIAGRGAFSSTRGSVKSVKDKSQS